MFKKRKGVLSTKNREMIKITMVLISLAVIFSVSTGSVSAASGDQMYVNGSYGNDSWDGSSWFTAKLTIKNATESVNQGGTVNIADGLYTEENTIAISKNMTIKGQSKENTILNGNSTKQIFTVQNGVTVIIQNLTFTNGSADNGGAVYNEGNLTVMNCTFTNNTANNGGAIYNDGTFTGTSNTFANNTASSDGGAIFTFSGTLYIENSSFDENNASRYGGAIANKYSEITLNSCTFSRNNAVPCSGAIDNYSGNVNVNNCTFTGNTASGYQGGAITNSGTLNVNNSTFIGNNAVNTGGAISTGGICTITDSKFYNNSASAGGAIYNVGTLTITNNTFTGNRATGESGGAIAGSYGTTLNIAYSTFSGNSASSKGGAVYSYYLNSNVAESDFTDNVAGSQGGAIWSNSNLVVNNSLFTGNRATGESGGAVYFGGNLDLNNSIFTNNTANYGGAIAASYGTTLNIVNCTLTNNTAYGNGGAISDSSAVNIKYSTFSGNYAGSLGGAISNNGDLNIVNSNFSNNSAYNGGAINKDGGTFHVSGSDFVVNKAVYGGAIRNIYGNSDAHFNRFVGNSATTGNAICCDSGALNATINWWGSNNDPSANVTGGVDVSNWLVLVTTANATTVNLGDNATVTASLLYDNGILSDPANLELYYHDPVNGHVPDGIPVVFSSDTGAVDPENMTIVNGSATTIFTAESNGNVSIVRAVVDDESQSAFNITEAFVRNINTGKAYSSIGEAISDPETHDGDIITLVAGTYTGDNNKNIVINKNLTVIGKNQDNTIIDAENSGRIFTVQSGITAVIQNLTFKNGHTDSGGAVYNEGNLTITNCTFINNIATGSGGAIFTPSGTLCVNNCTFIENNANGVGGAIANSYSDITINSCTFSENTAGAFAGAIDNYQGDVNVNNCIFTGCSSSRGGVISNSGTIAIVNSTFENNTATDSGGAIWNDRGILTATGSNFTGNTANDGGAICNANNQCELHFNRFTGNTASSGRDISSGGIVSATYNWWGSNSDPSGNIAGNVDVSKWLVLTLNADPASTSLRRNLTATASLLYDNGILSDPANLELYYHDPVNGHVPDGIPVTFNSDGLGSVDPENTLIVNGSATTTFTAGPNVGTSIVRAVLDNETQNVTVNITEGPVKNINTGKTYSSIGEAINDPETVDGDTITISAGTYIGSSNRDMVINKSLTIIGEGRDITIIDAQGSGRIFVINSGANVIIKNLTLQHGQAGCYNIVLYNDYGGTIYNEGNLTIYNISFDSNSGGGIWDGGGGAIFNIGNLNIYNSTFRNDVAFAYRGRGGAIFNAGYLTVTDSYFTINAATYGGAIFDSATGISIVIRDTFVSNGADYGGTLYNWGSLIVEDSILTGGAGFMGTDIYNADNGEVHGNLNITKSCIFDTIWSDNAAAYAQNNWWGTNFEGTDPVNSGLVNGNVNAGPWIVLTLTANQTNIKTNDTVQVIVDLLHNSDGAYLDPVNGHVPDGIPVSFGCNLGNVDPANTVTVNGSSIALFTAGVVNCVSTIQASVNSEIQSVIVAIGEVGPIWNVNTGKTYSTIGDVINDSETLNGQKIIVNEGTYTENIVLNKSLNLIASGIVIIQALNPANPAILITPDGSGSTIQGFYINGSSNSQIYIDTANGVTITNNTINGSLGDSKSVWGVCLVNSGQNNIINNIVTGCEEGINLYNSHQNTISSNTVKNNHWDNIALNLSTLNSITGNIISNADSGIRLIGASNNNTITNNNLTANIWTSISLVDSLFNQITMNLLNSNQEGMYLYSSNNNTIDNNTANNNVWDGIAIHDSSNNTITNHTSIIGNNCGIRVIGISSNNEIMNNDINGNIWSDISLDTATNNIIHNNNLSNAHVGLYLQASSNNQVYNNTIQNNSWDGIDIFYSSNNNTIENNTVSGSYYGQRILSSTGNTNYQNNYVNSTIQAFDDSTNSWDNGVDTGNYWSDWNTTDPRSIDGGNGIDNHPSLTQF